MRCVLAFPQADRATAAVNLEAHYQVPPHMLFELLADPTQHDKIFDAILVRSDAAAVQRCSALVGHAMARVWRHACMPLCWQGPGRQLTCIVS